MFVQGDEFAERTRRQPFSEDGIRRSVAFEDAMRHEPVRDAFGLDLLLGLAEGEGLSLREHIGQEDVVLMPQRIQRLFEGDKVTRNEPRSLMNQLVKRVLAVGTWLAPVNGAGCMRDLRFQ